MRFPNHVKPNEPVKAADHNAVLDLLRALVLQPGVGYGVRRDGGGTTLDLLPSASSAAAASESPACILGTMSADPANEGKFMLEPGYLSGGGGSEPVAPVNLTAAIGHHVYLIIGWTADEVDDVLMSGGTLGAVTVGVAATIPDDTVPDINSLTGTAHVPLGSWISDGATPTPAAVWSGAGCGNVGLYFCPAQGFIYSRI